MSRKPAHNNANRRFGATVAAFDSWGSSDPLLYADGRTNSPNSSGVMFQLDHTPWGAGASPLGPRFNLRVGAQFTAYTEFDSARHNYDGAGHDASDNDTLRGFAWVAY